MLMKVHGRSDVCPALMMVWVLVVVAPGGRHSAQDVAQLLGVPLLLGSSLGRLIVLMRGVD